MLYDFTHSFDLFVFLVLYREVSYREQKFNKFLLANQPLKYNQD